MADEMMRCRYCKNEGICEPSKKVPNNSEFEDECPDFDFDQACLDTGKGFLHTLVTAYKPKEALQGCESADERIDQDQVTVFVTVNISEVSEILQIGRGELSSNELRFPMPPPPYMDMLRIIGIGDCWRKNESGRSIPPEIVTHDIPTLFYADDDGFKCWCLIGEGSPFIAHYEKTDHADLVRIRERNKRHGITWPYEDPEALINQIEGKPSAPATDSDQVKTFKVHTGQEIDAWQMATADGRTFAHWIIDQQAGEARHKRPDSNYLVLIRDRKDLDPVDIIIRKQDANTGLAALYVLGVMEIAKYGPLPAGATYTARIDLLDVAKKSGMITRQGKHEREQARARVWGLLQFGARAEVTGARSTTYYDPDTGKTIPTRLGCSSLWSLQSPEYPDEDGQDQQQKLFPLDDVPLRVRVTLNKDWEPFLFGAHLPQYLRFGEKIGAIPAGKPSGAWAQAMSLCYLHWARVFPRDAKAGKAPTRRELLTKYPPAVGDLGEYLTMSGGKPKRIVETYLQSLEIMAEEGIIARAGDVLTTADEQLQGFPRKGWLDPWLDAPANIRPGQEILQSIETEILPSLPPARPRALKGMGGRPRKRPDKGKGG